MSYVYTAYPTTANVISYASAIMPNIATQIAAVDTATLTAMIAGAAARIEQSTGRQFTTVSEARYFDGSGTGVQIVDDYVSIDQDSSNYYKVYIYAIPGQTSGFLQLGWIQPVAEPGRASRALQIYQGPTVAAYAYYSYFPQGRSNVQVYATWGYASTIPADIFELVMADCADKLISGLTLSDHGVLESAKDGDAAYGFANSAWWKVSGWDKRQTAILATYKRDITTMVARRQVAQY